MTDTSTQFNPYGIKMAHLMRAQQAFGVKVLPLMKKVELIGDNGGTFAFDPTDLELEELLTLVFLALDMGGESPTKESVLDMDLSELEGYMPKAEDIVAPDPT